MYDLIIVGSGPAGVSAALSARARNLNFLWFGNREKIEEAAEKFDTIKELF